VNQVRFHAQRQLLATCSDDRTARIWALKDILARARGGVPTPSGSGGAAAAEDSPLVLRGHKNNVSTVDWCPAQPGGALLLATTSFDGTTRVWDGATGACLRTFADHKTPVFAVAFSPDGRWLATGGGDGFLFVYDVAVRAARCRRSRGRGGADASNEQKREKRWTWDAGEVDDADERAQTRTKGIFEIDWQQVDGRNRMAVSLESKHVAVVDVRRVPELNP
jgi:transducin (beta)-like 1